MSELETKCIHGSADFTCADPSRPISFPIYQTASYGHNYLTEKTGYDYTRETNPTRSKLESVISALEGAADTMAFTSGMAAISCCLKLFQPGEHIVCSEDLYGGTNRILKTVSGKNGITSTFLDTSDPAQVEAALRPETKAVYLETPTNPMMMVTDIAAIAAITKPRNILLIVDNYATQNAKGRGQNGGSHINQQNLAANASYLLDVGGTGDTHDQRGKDKGNDGHLDEVQVSVAHDVEDSVDDDIITDVATWHKAQDGTENQTQNHADNGAFSQGGGFFAFNVFQCNSFFLLRLLGGGFSYRCYFNLLLMFLRGEGNSMRATGCFHPRRRRIL